MANSGNRRLDEGFRGSLSRGDVRVDLEYIGEGLRGDYNAHDLDDTPFLRFTILYREAPLESCRTQLSANISEGDVEKALNLLMSYVYDPIVRGEKIGVLAERLSCIDATWLEGNVPENF